MEEHREPKLINLHPHVLRHPFVTNCAQAGISPEVIQKIVGHTDIKTINHYTHLQSDYIKEQYEKYIRQMK